jgi:probable phosphoglycerate mutase
MRLYLARHAQTSSNVSGALDTARPGAPLTGLGHRQAQRLAGRLAGVPLTAVAASGLLRAQQTAAPLAAGHGLAVATVEGLREVDAGDLEMQTAAEATERYTGLLHAWADGDLDAALPGGIDGHEFTSRFDEAVRTVEEAARAAGNAAGGTARGISVLAVSHGAAIRTWTAIRCRGADPVAVSRRRLANTAVVIVEGSARDGWRLAGRIEDHLEAPDSATVLSRP